VRLDSPSNGAKGGSEEEKRSSFDWMRKGLLFFEADEGEVQSRIKFDMNIITCVKSTIEVKQSQEKEGTFQYVFHHWYLPVAYNMSEVRATADQPGID
jgi:hypothetical protein